MPRHENYPAEFQGHITSGVGGRRTRDARSTSLNWDDIAKFRDMWPGILMLKGVNRLDDAVKAIRYGVDGIIVSNHGGRNMDSAAATMRLLPEIAEAVGDKRDRDPRFRRPPRLRHRQGAGAGRQGGADRARDAVWHRGRRRGGGGKAINIIRTEFERRWPTLAATARTRSRPISSLAITVPTGWRGFGVAGHSLQSYNLVMAGLRPGHLAPHVPQQIPAMTWLNPAVEN